MDILEKLFGGAAQVKIMRLFLCNPDEPFETKDVKNRSHTSSAVARREVSRLYNLGLIKPKKFTVSTQKKLKSRVKIFRRKAKGWILDREFSFVGPLRDILLHNGALHKGNVADRFRNIGSLKGLVVSGVFVNDLNVSGTGRGRVDVLLIGDRLNQRAIRNILKRLESEMGRELHYAILKTSDFLYRRGVYDKFIRDIFDYPHEVLVDKIGI